MIHGIKYWLGLTDPSGEPYLWWSGFGGRVALGGALIITYLRHHNCHTPGCWRLQRRIQADGRALCHRHARAAL